MSERLTLSELNDLDSAIRGFIFRSLGGALDEAYKEMTVRGWQGPPNQFPTVKQINERITEMKELGYKLTRMRKELRQEAKANA
jgi:hypothetical protein